MKKIPVTRASYLIEFTRWFDKIGTPVKHELTRARLPLYLDETPEAFVSLNLVTDFLMRNAIREGIDDLGFEAGWHTHYENFSPVMLNALNNAPTVRSRIEKFIHFVYLEDNTVRASMRCEGTDVRVCIAGDYPEELDLRISEWQQLKALIEVVRAGKSNWLPTEMTFRSDFTPGFAALEQLGNTRIRTAQAETSILFPLSVFAAQPASRLINESITEPDPVIMLRKTIEPYLSYDRPSIGLAADIAGCSKRSLQRHLHEQKTSFSELIEQVRYEKATHLLTDKQMKIIDVAMSVGYSDASNFSRAFRRISGLRPGEFRKQF